MRRRANENLELFRETQRTRISRWIRNSEAGWLFYDQRGTAWHLLSDEAVSLEREAGRIVGRCVARQRRWSARILRAIGFAIAAFVGGTYFGFFRDFEAVVALGGLIFAFFLWTIGSFIIEFLYHRQIRNWRQRTADALARDLRGGVPTRWRLTTVVTISSVSFVPQRLLSFSLESSGFTRQYDQTQRSVTRSLGWTWL